MDIDEEIARLDEKLKKLYKSNFDTDLFETRRNYIQGTYMADLVSPANLEWNGAFTTETHPQHWLYHLMLAIKMKFPRKYALISEKYDVYESKLYNDGTKRKRPSLSIADLWDINRELFNTIVLDQKERIPLTTKLRQTQRALILERKQERLDVEAQLTMLKEKVTLN
jgi:hypothetical protein